MYMTQKVISFSIEKTALAGARAFTDEEHNEFEH